MTPDEIDALKPGPLLDALVAKHVMRWTESGDAATPWVAEGGAKLGPKAFSTDIATALSAAHTLRERATSPFYLKQIKFGRLAGQWMAGFEKDTEAFASDYAEATCKAMLKSVFLTR